MIRKLSCDTIADKIRNSFTIGNLFTDYSLFIYPSIYLFIHSFIYKDMLLQ